jgi:3-dehydroquinate synthase
MNKDTPKTITLSLGERSYDITVGQNILSDAGKLFNLQRKALIITDSGVPKEYAETVAKCAKESRIFTVNSGEGSKSLDVFKDVIGEMTDFGMTRTDCLVAVGGGVVGDLTGFASSVYMRGIDFYNVPTTLLSQVDSSIGGKTAVNFGSIKNIIGAFHQPSGVLIDTETLKTLDKRQFSAGLAEAVKMALTSNSSLFELFENEDVGEENIDKIIISSLLVKKSVVEEDEKESGIRKILNFGHTLGHAIEANEQLSLLHGECVALGMLGVCSRKVKERLIPVLKKLGLPTEYNGDIEKAFDFISLDKKCDGDSVSAIFVEEVGSYIIRKMNVGDFINTLRANI